MKEVKVSLFALVILKLKLDFIFINIKLFKCFIILFLGIYLKLLVVIVILGVIFIIFFVFIVYSVKCCFDDVDGWEFNMVVYGKYKYLY